MSDVQQQEWAETDEQLDAWGMERMIRTHERLEHR